MAISPQDGQRGFVSDGHTDHVTVLGLNISEGPTSGQVRVGIIGIYLISITLQFFKLIEIKISNFLNLINCN